MAPTPSSLSSWGLVAIKYSDFVPNASDIARFVPDKDRVSRPRAVKKRYNLAMRRSIITAALLLALSGLPLCAQRRGFASPPMRAAVGVRPSGRMFVRGGFGFGHNPRFHVFFGPRFHHRRFFRPFFFPYAVPIYPYYYPFGYQSDFVYSNYAAQPAYGEREAVSVSDLNRLQAEVDQLRQEQTLLLERAEAAPPRSSPQAAPAAAARETPAPPTVLVYRDGHRIEARNYAIAGRTLWIFSEERARKVSLAELDLDATIRANEERGVEFPVRR